MVPAAMELLAILAVIGSIVAYSARRATRTRETGGRMAAQGHPNSEVPSNLAEIGAKQSSSAGMEQAAGVSPHEKQSSLGR
jgi:hypothetical protein